MHVPLPSDLESFSTWVRTASPGRHILLQSQMYYRCSQSGPVVPEESLSRVQMKKRPSASGERGPVLSSTQMPCHL